MRVAVTGASGLLGNTLVRALLARGEHVRALVLGSAMPASLAGLDVEIIQGSVLDRQTVASLLDGVDLAFHLAAKIDLDRDRDGSVRATNLDGTRIVAEACADARIRLVHCSSHAALVKQPLSRPLDETKPLSLDDPCDYHRSKALAEKLVLDLARERGLDAVVTSPGSLVGPYDFEPSMIGRALLDLYHRRVPVLMDVLTDYVDVRDVAEGLLLAAEKGRTGERYLLTGEVLELRELVAIWGEHSGVPMPKRVLPLWVGWAMLPVTLAVSRVTKRPPLFTAGVLRASVSNRVVSHEKASRELGWQTRSIAAALKDALEFYRERGWLLARAAFRH